VAITMLVCVPKSRNCSSKWVARAIGIVDHVLKREPSKPPSARLGGCKGSTPWRVCARALIRAQVLIAQVLYSLR
jgi:hypothetical protein